MLDVTVKTGVGGLSNSAHLFLKEELLKFVTERYKSLSKCPALLVAAPQSAHPTAQLKYELFYVSSVIS